MIVPTLSARAASYERLMASLPRRGVNVIKVPDPPTCGEGWIEGLKSSAASHVALIADDLEFINEDWMDACRAITDEGMLPCPRVYRPDGGIESQGGDMNALGHILPRPRAHRTLTDFTTVPFCSREQIEEIGMIPTQYGCDVWVSYRGRQLGIRTVLCHGYDLVHHQEQAGRGAGMDQNERDAMDTETLKAELARTELESYGTHLEVLELVLALRQPQLVLELGSGLNSTPAILDAPSVTQLISLEDDPEWFGKVLQEIPDERLDLRQVPSVADAVPTDIYLFDLIFIDNGASEHERERTIRDVLSALHHDTSPTGHPTVVIHDAENPSYLRAIEELTAPHRRTIITGRKPHTAVIW